MRKLERTRKDNVLSGVCGGIAKYFNIDVTVVRALWVLSAIFEGPGLGVYIICAILIPKEKYNKPYEKEDDNDLDRDERSRNYLGFALIAIGAFMAVKQFLPDLSFKFVWPALLIGVGFLLLNRNRQKEDY